MRLFPMRVGAAVHGIDEALILGFGLKPFP